MESSTDLQIHNFTIHFLLIFNNTIHNSITENDCKRSWSLPFYIKIKIWLSIFGKGIHMKILSFKISITVHCGVGDTTIGLFLPSTPLLLNILYLPFKNDTYLPLNLNLKIYYFPVCPSTQKVPDILMYHLFLTRCVCVRGNTVCLFLYFHLKRLMF